MPEKDAKVTRWLAWAIVGLHLALLLAALPNYRASVDSAYHTAIGRQYGIHGTYFWDDIHYAPAHRPNLQGPAVHFGIGLLGRLLGGDGDDYVAANALLGVFCWLTGVGTVGYFARKLSGYRAALLTTAVLTGAANASGSLSMNLPVFWMFLATGWSIYFLLERRLAMAIGLASLACYAHLGGFATVPVGLAAATLCHGDFQTVKQRFQDLAIVGLGVVVVTSPYWLHVLGSLRWYQGVKGDSAWWIDPLIALWWLVGLAVAIRTPRFNSLLIAWAAAPLVWIVQDASRFILMSALPGAVLGSVAIAGWLNRWQRDWARVIATGTIVYLATVFPLWIPALGGEILWLVKPFPIMLDWEEMRADAEVIRKHRLNDKIVQGYTSYVVSALSVFADIKGEEGHWIEVQPPVDPSDDFGVAEKTYVVALSPRDEVIASWEERGWIASFGGGRWSCVLRFTQRPTLKEAVHARNETFAREAAWLADHAEHNTMGNFFAIVFNSRELPRRRAARGESRTRVTRMQIAMLLYAFALEPIDARRARQARDNARALGWIAALQADEMSMDYRSAKVHEQFRQDLAALATVASQGQPIEKAFDQLLERYLGAARGSLFSIKSRP